MNRLEKHNILAIDFDDTLIGHKNSQRICDHIRYNPSKTYWIITFRTGPWADTDIMEQELYHMSGLTLDRFEGIKSIPKHIYDGHTSINSDRKAGVPEETLSRREEVFKEWKGKTAAELGCTVLIDDIADWTEEGCGKHGVDFVNTHSIKPFNKSTILT